MVEKLPKPILFDKDVDWLVVARDGEKFYVSRKEDLASGIDKPLTDLKPKTLLEWAMLSNYPLNKFVRVQRVLTAKFFGT
jgi:hypothetical protein